VTSRRSRSIAFWETLFAVETAVVCAPNEPLAIVSTTRKYQNPTRIFIDILQREMMFLMRTQVCPIGVASGREDASGEQAALTEAQVAGRHEGPLSSDFW
jgi:hypothetical protein